MMENARSLAEVDLDNVAEATVTENKTAAPCVVFKYVMTQPVMRFTMPAGARVIDVQAQHGTPTLWALCPAEGEPEQREFIGHGTGHPILEDGLIYVGSAHNVEGEGLVFHIFERPIPGGDGA